MGGVVAMCFFRFHTWHGSWIRFPYLNKNIRKGGGQNSTSRRLDFLEIGPQNAFGPDIDSACRSGGDEWCPVGIVGFFRGRERVARQSPRSSIARITRSSARKGSTTISSVAPQKCKNAMKTREIGKGSKKEQIRQCLEFFTTDFQSWLVNK